MAASLMPHQLSDDDLKRRTSLKAVATHSERAPLHLVIPDGLLKVHSAPYRGSFSGVLSEALRAAGLGSKVMVAQFLKGGVHQGPQGVVKLCGGLEWIRPDIACCVEQQETQNINELKERSSFQAINEIWELCKNKILQGTLDLLVLDEIGLAIEFGFLKENELITTLEKRPISMDVILTGPSIPSSILAIADQITELRCGF